MDDTRDDASPQYFLCSYTPHDGVYDYSHRHDSVIIIITSAFVARVRWHMPLCARPAWPVKVTLLAHRRDFRVNRDRVHIDCWARSFTSDAFIFDECGLWDI